MGNTTKKEEKSLGNLVENFTKEVRKWIVFKREIHNNFVLVDATSAKEAISRVERGDGREMLNRTEFVKELPASEWCVEPLNEGVLDDEDTTNS